MSLLGKIVREIPLIADIVDSIRFTDKPIESLGLRPSYGEDGMGLGLLLPPTSEQPVDPSKLQPSLQPPLPIIIFGQDEICVGINIGLGYEMKGLVCHRKTPAPPPKPPIPPLPPSLPPPPSWPDIPPEAIVTVAILRGSAAYDREEYGNGSSYERLTIASRKVNEVKEIKNEDGSIAAYTLLFEQNNSSNQIVNGGRPNIGQGGFGYYWESYTTQFIGRIENLYILNDQGGFYGIKTLRQGSSQKNIFITAPAVVTGQWQYILPTIENEKYVTRTTETTTTVNFIDLKIIEGFDDSYKPTPGDPFLPGDICQPPPCPPMNCCCNGNQNNDDKELMRAIARAVGATSAQYWMELPKTLKTGKSSLFGAIPQNQTVKIQSQSDFNAWLVGQLNELFGQFQVEIEVPAEAQKGSKTEGNQLAGKVIITDVASGFAQVVKLLLNTQDDESENRSFLSRILVESHMARLAALDAAARAKILQDWSTAEIEEVEIEVPTSFTLPNLQKDLDSIDTKAEIAAFLKESKRKIKQPRFKGKATFKQLINPLLQGAAIIRAVFAERINPATAKEDIKKHLKGKDEIASGRLGGTSSKTGGSESIKTFIKNLEKQFPGAKIEIVKKDK